MLARVKLVVDRGSIPKIFNPSTDSKFYINTMKTSKVWQNLTIPSQEANECLFLSSSDLKSYYERNLDSTSSTNLLSLPNN